MKNRKITISIILIACFMPVYVKSNTVNSSLEELKKYAERYEPNAPEGFIPYLPDPPQNIKEILESSPISEELSQYVCLIILKLHRWYMENSRKGYDLRKTTNYSPEQELNIILLTFAKIARIDNSFLHHPEGPYSSMVELWITLHPYYTRYKPIDDEISRIRKVRKNIQEGLYRKR